jgi:hypothetical protein
VVGEVREYDELADIYQKLDTVRITTSIIEDYPRNSVVISV